VAVSSVLTHTVQRKCSLSLVTTIITINIILFMITILQSFYNIILIIILYIMINRSDGWLLVQRWSDVDQNQLWYNYYINIIIIINTIHTFMIIIIATIIVILIYFNYSRYSLFSSPITIILFIIIATIIYNHLHHHLSSSPLPPSSSIIRGGSWIDLHAILLIPGMDLNDCRLTTKIYWKVGPYY